MQFAFSRATRPHKNGLRAAGARRALVHAAGDRKESAARKTRHGSSKGVGEDLSKILLVPPATRRSPPWIYRKPSGALPAAFYEAIHGFIDSHESALR
jgi:hypothetical protein